MLNFVEFSYTISASEDSYLTRNLSHIISDNNQSGYYR